MQQHKQPVKRLGAWDTGPPWANNTTYLAATDGEVHCFRYNSAGDLAGFTDPATPATVQRQGNFAAVTTHYYGFTLRVRKGEYWKVTGTTSIFWIPEEP